MTRPTKRGREEVEEGTGLDKADALRDGCNLHADAASIVLACTFIVPASDHDA